MFDWIQDLVQTIVAIIFIAPPVVIAALSLFGALVNPDPLKRMEALKKFGVAMLFVTIAVVVVILLDRFVYPVLF